MQATNKLSYDETCNQIYLIITSNISRKSGIVEIDGKSIESKINSKLNLENQMLFVMTQRGENTKRIFDAEIFINKVKSIWFFHFTLIEDFSKKKNVKKGMLHLILQNSNINPDLIFPEKKILSYEHGDSNDMEESGIVNYPQSVFNSSYLKYIHPYNNYYKTNIFDFMIIKRFGDTEFSYKSSIYGNAYGRDSLLKHFTLKNLIGFKNGFEIFCSEQFQIRGCFIKKNMFEEFDWKFKPELQQLILEYIGKGYPINVHEIELFMDNSIDMWNVVETNRINRISYVSMHDRGDNWNWSKVFATKVEETLIPSVTGFIKPNRVGFVDESDHITTVSDISDYQNLKTDSLLNILDNSRITAIKGRTIFIKTRSNMMACIKIKKTKEEISTLEKEIQMIVKITQDPKLSKIFPYLATTKLWKNIDGKKDLVHLDSVYKMDSTKKSLRESIKERLKEEIVKSGEEYDVDFENVVYITYTINTRSCEGDPLDFTVYLEEMSLDTYDWETISRSYLNIAEQMGQLYAAGYVHSSLINLFHSIGRQYIVTAPIIGIQLGRSGIGRLDKIFQTAKFSNMRLLGIADFAEIMSLKEFGIKFYEEASETDGLYNSRSNKSYFNNLEAVTQQFFCWMINLIYNEFITNRNENWDITNKKRFSRLFYDSFIVYLSKAYGYSKMKMVGFVSELGYTFKTFEKITEEIDTFCSYKYVKFLMRNDTVETLSKSTNVSSSLIHDCVFENAIKSLFNQKNNVNFNLFEEYSQYWNPTQAPKDPIKAKHHKATKIMNRFPRGWTTIVIYDEKYCYHEHLGFTFCFDSINSDEEFYRYYFDLFRQKRDEWFSSSETTVKFISEMSNNFIENSDAYFRFHNPIFPKKEKWRIKIDELKQKVTEAMILWTDEFIKKIKSNDRFHYKNSIFTIDDPTIFEKPIIFEFAFELFKMYIGNQILKDDVFEGYNTSPFSKGNISLDQNSCCTLGRNRSNFNKTKMIRILGTDQFKVFKGEYKSFSVIFLDKRKLSEEEIQDIKYRLYQQMDCGAVNGSFPLQLTIDALIGVSMRLEYTNSILSRERISTASRKDWWNICAIKRFNSILSFLLSENYEIVYDYNSDSKGNDDILVSANLELIKILGTISNPSSAHFTIILESIVPIFKKWHCIHYIAMSKRHGCISYALLNKIIKFIAKNGKKHLIDTCEYRENIQCLIDFICESIIEKMEIIEKSHGYRYEESRKKTTQFENNLDSIFHKSAHPIEPELLMFK